MRRLVLFCVLVFIPPACSSSPQDGKSENPGKPVKFPASAARTGTATISLEGVEYGSGLFAVVFAHERTGGQDAWTQLAREAAAKGLRALTFNFRGYGVSEGSRANLGLIDLDVEGAVKYLLGTGASKVFVVGGDMGATAALVSAARVPIEGVVALSASSKFMGLDAAAAVPKLKIPVLYVAAAQDTAAAADARALTALRGNQTREIVTGAEHGSQLLAGDRGTQLRSRILTFIQENSVKT